MKYLKLVLAKCSYLSAPLELRGEVGDGVAVLTLLVTLVDGLLDRPDTQESPQVGPGDGVVQPLRLVDGFQVSDEVLQSRSNTTIG